MEGGGGEVEKKVRGTYSDVLEVVIVGEGAVNLDLVAYQKERHQEEEKNVKEEGDQGGSSCRRSCRGS